MNLLNLALLASAETEGASDAQPAWVYGVATFIIFMLLLVLVTRLNIDR